MRPLAESERRRATRIIESMKCAEALLKKRSAIFKVRYFVKETYVLLNASEMKLIRAALVAALKGDEL